MSTESVPSADEPPNLNVDWHTIEDQRWKLQKYTSELWSIDSCSYEHNDHANVRCTKIDMSLSHETGAKIVCIPIDPWDHHPGPTIYRRHRVCLRDSPYHDVDQVVTLETDNVPSTAAKDLIQTPGDPFDGSENQIQTTPAPEVVRADERIEESKFGRGNNIESIDGALWAVIGSARQFSTHYNKHRGWFFDD